MVSWTCSWPNCMDFFSCFFSPFLAPSWPNEHPTSLLQPLVPRSTSKLLDASFTNFPHAAAYIVQGPYNGRIETICRQLCDKSQVKHSQMTNTAHPTITLVSTISEIPSIVVNICIQDIFTVMYICGQILKQKADI